jgi:hypothetical protein
MPFTDEETTLMDSLGYHPSICAIAQEAARRPLERIVLTQYDDNTEGWVQSPGNAISVVMSRDRAEAFVRQNQDRLNTCGYSAYASERRDSRGCKAAEELVLLKSTDPYEIIRIRDTYGWEDADSNLTADEIISRLKKWDDICGVILLGAGPDWLSLEFKSLPADLGSLAFEVYNFCSEGVGEFYDDEEGEDGKPMWYRQVDAEYPERIERAYTSPAGLKDAERAEADEKHAKLVAIGLKSDRYQFFWWD